MIAEKIDSEANGLEEVNIEKEKAGVLGFYPKEEHRWRL